MSMSSDVAGIRTSRNFSLNNSGIEGRETGLTVLVCKAEVEMVAIVLEWDLVFHVLQGIKFIYLRNVRAPKSTP